MSSLRRELCFGMDYFILTNEELVELVKNNDECAFEVIISRFGKFVNFKSRFYILNGCDENLVKEEARKALRLAAINFSNQSEYFAMYASEIVGKELEKLKPDNSET